jgi:hypothetical protein|nr:MAG TPA: hypothetical protein [Caudoviricetes sp.]
MKSNKYPSWLVTKDIAKKLKEIGYNEECYFELNDENKVVIEIDIMEDSSIIDVTDLIPYKNDYYCTPSVPTWTEVLEWFRKRNLVGLVTHRYRSKNDNGFSFEVLDIETEIIVYKTYEEAQEALVYKLIEIYKETNNIKNEE